MVRGVNKQIIEINDTGNSYFERVLLFVSPNKADLPVEQLNSEAKTLLFKLSPEFKQTTGLRLFHKQKRLKKALLTAFVSVTVIAAITVLIFYFL
ncbi:MAG: hypothetical protein J6Q67_07865 [Clostridia bacterium]|nr:hypothetical protein [Clostridia bacterium]